jgi:dipeptidyl aminopeptidase/acylaminoacyl peptidase
VTRSRFVLCQLVVSAVVAHPGSIAAQRPDSVGVNQSRRVAGSSVWTADDLLLSQDAKHFRVSPDGRSVAWIQTAMTTATGRVESNVYLAPVRGGPVMQLTRGNYSLSSLRWSPDGTRISYLGSQPLPDSGAAVASHAASTQLWILDMRGGEPWPVTRLEHGIDDYAWTGRDTIVYMAQGEPTAYERLMRERKDDSRVIDDSVHEPPVHLFSLSLSTRKTRQLTDNTDWIQDFSVAPDGVTAVVVHERSLSEGYDQRIPSITRLTNLATGASRVIYDGKRTIPGNITWANDGSGFYFTNDTTTSKRYRTATIGVLDFYDVASGRTIPVDHSWPRGVIGNLRPTPDGVIANLGNGVFIQPARYVRSRNGNAWSRELIAGAHADHAFDIDISADARTIVYRYTRANVPPQLFGATLTGARVAADTQLTNLNPTFAARPQPKVEVVHWKGARDETVEGILTYPLNYSAGARYPLVLTIHGGPALADLDEWKQTWSYPRLLLNQKGAFTLQVNYHGSSRYGLRWVESICCGNIYDLETPDLERGVAYVVGRGLADTAKLGTLGHSYGAILTAQLTTVDQRFKAASAAAGDVEWFSDWGNVHFGASYDNYYFGSSPWDDPALYVRKSPVFRFRKVRTPTIIYQGTEDTQVPPGEGWTYFRTLQQLGNVPVRFVIFPGEAHSPSKYVHQRRKIDEDMAWFDRYLFGVTNGPIGPTGP